MIHKFERLTSVGKFRDYQAAGPVSFTKLTLIYADNGSGKTTLAAILRSLTENRPELVRRRISTAHTTPQIVQIIQRDPATNADTHHTLRTTGWSNPFPNIEIFDIEFVNENIYSGFDFTEDHKRQLHHFVVGAQGVAIKRQIETNKTAKTVSRQNQETIIAQIVQSVGNGLTAEMIYPFIAIPATQAVNIDARILAAQTSLAGARANAAIQRLQFLSEIAGINIPVDFAAIITDLQSTTQTIQDLALKTIFDDHCQDLNTHGIHNTDGWLRTGFDYLKNVGQQADGNTSCPFCTQPIGNNIDVIRAYALRFNDEFNNLISRLQGHITTLRGINIDAVAQALNNFDTTNSERIRGWSTHLPNTVVPPTFNIISNLAGLKVEFTALIGLLETKIQNPSASIVVTAATTLQATLASIQSNIIIYNRAVQTYNSAINAFKGSIKTEAVALNELNLANRIKKRFETATDTLCSQLATERQNLRTLEQDYTRLSQQEEAAAATFFASYSTRINHYLRDIFRTPFLIDSVAHVPPQGRATHSKINYKLTLNGSDISFDPGQPLSAKDCLSEGDKSTLALAFFMAKLDIDPNIADKVIVFDDPLSSFDNNRRLYTVQLLKDLLPTVRQLVVMSHNEFFLAEIYKDADRGLRKALRIAEDFRNNTSKIELLDLDKMVENEHFKHLNELDDFLTNSDITKKERVLGLMRNVLEAHIRFKFYRQTSGISENQRTFGRLIDELVTQAVVFRDNANNATIIAKLRLINSVSCKPHHGEPVPNYATLGVDPSTITVRALADLVTDTLNLLDNQL